MPTSAEAAGMYLNASEILSSVLPVLLHVMQGRLSFLTSRVIEVGRHSCARALPCFSLNSIRSGTLLDSSACSAFPYSKKSQACLQASGDLPIALHQPLEFSEHRDVLQTSTNAPLHLQKTGKTDSVSAWC